MTNDTFEIENTELFKNIASSIAESYSDFRGSEEEKVENFDSELLYVAWLEGEGEWVVASEYEVLYDCLDSEEEAEEIRRKLENAIFEIINKKEEGAALDSSTKTVELTELVEDKKEIKLLEEMGYDLQEEILNEESVLSEFEDRSDDEYICDIIAEIADSSIPIYTNDLWENAKHISEYIEEAIGNGLAVMDGGIIPLLQSGYYQYYTSLFYDNLKALAFNYVIKSTNEKIKAACLVLDIQELEDSIFSELEDIDNDSTFGELETVIKSISSRIDDGEFNA